MSLFYFNAKINQELHTFFEKVLKNTKENPFFSDVSIEQIDGTKGEHGTYGLYKFSFNHLFPDVSKYILIMGLILLVIRFFVNSLFLTVPLMIITVMFLINKFFRSPSFMYLIMKAGLKEHGYNIKDLKWRGQKC